MASHTSLIVILSTLAEIACAECINESVVALPVTDVSLSNEHTVRGVPISVGTPPSNISFLPEAVYNDTCKSIMLRAWSLAFPHPLVRDIQ